MFLENTINHAKQSGWMEVICGSMFSGKTEELIRRLRRAEMAGQQVEIFKPKLDNRYADEEVVSHNQNKIKSTPVETPDEILLLGSNCDVVGIDEAQFFDESIVWSEDILADEEYYLAGSFIKELNDNNSTMYQTIVELAVGNIAFNALQMTFLPTEVETLKKCVVFLDASHLFPFTWCRSK